MLDSNCIKAMPYKQTRGTCGGLKAAGEGTKILTVEGMCLCSVQKTLKVHLTGMEMFLIL
jgi:hypothetical protein